MTSSKSIRSKIDKAEPVFESCWETLTSLKKLAPDAKNFMRFQADLADALFVLEEEYLDVIRKRDALITTKAKVTQNYFGKHIRTLKSYQQAIQDAMDIGRSLGDAFAWFFYIKSQPLIEQHFKHSEVRHLAPGIGGRGEVEFIRNVRFEGHFVLYHGITTFLRVGDISIVDLEMLRVIALGELKSKKTGHNKITVSLHLIGKKSSSHFWDNLRPGSKRSTKTPLNTPSALSAKIQKQLKKQMTTMSQTILEPKVDLHKRLEQAMHIREINQLADTVRHKRWAFQQVQDGLLLVASRPHRASSLSGRLLSKISGTEVAKRFRGLPDRVVHLCEKGSTENSIWIGRLETKMSLGFMPLFWCDIDLGLLRSLHFRETHLVSIYNPVHFFKKLRNVGFQIEITRRDRKEEYRVSKQIGPLRCEIESFAFFLGLVQHQLFREEKILEILETITGSIKDPEKYTKGRIQISMAHFF